MQQEEDNLTRKNSFAKTERICSKKIIKNLIVQNNTLFVYPFKCYFLIDCTDNQEDTNQIAISISKKIFKKAVDRNIVKRRVKEAYRLHKYDLVDSQNQLSLHKFKILFVYIAKEILTYQQMEKSLVQILKMVSQKSTQKL